MDIYQKRSKLQRVLFFVRWQLWPVVASSPGHLGFVARGVSDRRFGVLSRAGLALRVMRVHLTLPCAHAPMELLTIVEEILTVPESRPGVVIECGTWIGGSTAKLSHAAALAGRKLVVCDSFEGLPEVQAEDSLPDKDPFESGGFAARLEQVRDNVRRYGDLRVVEFVPGWFDKTLGTLPDRRVVCVFLDVDLQDSIKTCVSSLWARLEPGSKVFVHDVDRSPVFEPFQDRDWWAQHVASDLPEFVGALTGCGRQKRLLGYAVKARNNHSLTGDGSD
jgi:predicted O-methyltransferase YrrM